MSQRATSGPGRRSARIGSVAPSVARSVASHTAVSVVVAQDTPTKGTPGRPKALPKVKNRQSNAYGASGRIGAAQELSIPQTGFAEAFQTQRGQAIARNSEERQTSARSSSAAAGTPSRSGERGTLSQMDYESEDPPSEGEESEDEEDISNETSKSFGMSHEAGMLRQPTPQKQTPRNDRTSATGVVASGLRRPVESLLDRGRPEPDRRVPPLNPINALLAEKPSPPPVRESVASANTPRFPSKQTPNGGHVAPRPIPQRVTPERAVEPDVEPEVTLLDRARNWPWCYYALGALTALIALEIALFASSSTPKALSTQFADGWNRFTSLLTPGTSSSQSVHSSHLKSRIDDVELSLKDIQDFIHNLGDDVPDYVVVSRSKSGTMNVPKQFWDAIISRIRKDGPSIEWDTFVQNNQEKLQTALGTESAVIRQDLLKAIDSSFNEISADFDRKLESHTKIMLKNVEILATKEAKKVAVEHARLRSMALSNLIANIELQYGKPNYFSTGLGAHPVTAITSPTRSVTSLSGPVMRAFQRMVSPKINPPLAALQTWDEPGDCWCAAPDDANTGKAQLGIQLGEPIFPTQVTIEHLPRSAAPGEDTKSAPQNVEIWVESKEPALVRFAYDGNRCEDGPEGWQCLGKVRYDRNGANHVQTFLLDGESQTPVEKVLLRVTSNWGADHTCFYRVRLHGKGLREVPAKEASS
ncbi:hypothetical protein BU23DRAFT_492064 [Bimuria novae-zelandiae CBS 107.79]|uniref:SUN domain-containing protein n=1 Tax=Bimuria novae-zelandiae CBS 107.79 TaxID=1447943 RepID=A0A6A5UI47_9PLEO|nr:hypothetical protein BU23DRAFT_492064 [Bimuria novae-zelandiae CBS 107.79]